MKVTVSAKYSAEWQKVMKKVQTLGGVKGVNVGIVEPATNSETGESIAFYAACNEFGTKDIPSRPFMRMTAQKHMQEWARLFRQITSDKLIEDPSIAKRAFTAIGRVASADMQDMIKSNIGPANAPAYAAWKRSKPGSEAGGYAGTLVYTGQMLQSINFKLYSRLEEERQW